jgi:hypothetical protein
MREKEREGGRPGDDWRGMREAFSIDSGRNGRSKLHTLYA